MPQGSDLFGRCDPKDYGPFAQECLGFRDPPVPLSGMGVNRVPFDEDTHKQLDCARSFEPEDGW